MSQNPAMPQNSTEHDPTLYDPVNEHDACGVGFIADMHGRKSHTIVRKGLQILVNLTHRGACGCDELTGDGAGLLTQIPHDFYTAICAPLKIQLPAAGEYGVAMVFLPTLLSEREFCMRRFEELAIEEGQRFLGWRELPVDNAHIGHVAREVEPGMMQAFIARGPDTPADMFDWKLFIIRERLELEVERSAMIQKKFFYVPSISILTKKTIYPNGYF